MQPSSPLSHVQIAAIAFARIRLSEERVRLCRLQQQSLAEVKLEEELRGDDSQFDFEANSLQKRIVDYLRTQLGVRELPNRLIRAEASRRRLLKRVRREALLGLHPANRELLPLIAGFSNYQLRLLDEVAKANNPSELLQAPEMADLFIGKFRAGRGKDIIQYLAERWDHQKQRSKKRGELPGEIFNRDLLAVACLWTFPEAPLWLMPSAGAISIINGLHDHSEKPMTQPGYNNLVRKNDLIRLGQKVLDQFISRGAQDPQCGELRCQLEEVMRVKLEKVRRGRRPSP